MSCFADYVIAVLLGYAIARMILYIRDSVCAKKQWKIIKDRACNFQASPFNSKQHDYLVDKAMTRKFCCELIKLDMTQEEFQKELFGTWSVELDKNINEYPFRGVHKKMTKEEIEQCEANGLFEIE